MSAYIIVSVEVSDPEAYASYTRDVPATLEPYEGRFLVRGGAFEVLEGARASGRIVVIEFPSVEHAKAWQASVAYQSIAPIRHEHARTDFMVVVAGVK